MKLATRKLIILLAIVVVLAAANALAIVAWLDHSGIIDFAGHIRSEYLTGTAIAVIAALLYLLTEPIGMAAGWIKRCRVCQHLLLRRGKYCGRCGCRI
ncbi:MAG: hypothetical protein NTU53_02415 [Planctomycetota bacterium]|nr:hypothetical protein [Planctomycetota bacterium]